MSGEQIGLIAGVAVVVFWMVGAYNRLMAHRNAIGSALTQLAELLQRRSDAMVALATALAGLLPAERGTLEALLAADAQQRKALDALRQRPSAGPQVAIVATAENSLAASLARTRALLGQHPDALEGPVASQLAALGELEPRLVFARQLYNEAAGSYDAAAAQFPTRLLVRLFGFEPAGRL